MRKAVRSTAVFAILGAAVIVLVVAQGCTTSVHVAPHPELYISETPINVNVGLLVEEAQEFEYYTLGGTCLLGMLNSWRIETGPAFRLAAENAFKKIFAHVEIVRKPQQFQEGTLVLLVRPRISSFYVGQSLSATLVLSCSIVDRTGKVLYESSYPGTGPGRTGLVFVGGFFAGASALSSSSATAFDTAFTSMALDVKRTVDFSPYLGQ